GGGSEDLRTEDVERRARDSEEEHDDQDDPAPPEHAGQTAQRLLEVLRAFAGDAGRVPTTRGAVLGRREVELLLRLEGVVDDRHAPSSSPICDCTISAYVSQLSRSSSWVPLPMTSPSSTTRMLSAFTIVETRCATMMTAASRVCGTSAARRRASVARSS